MREPYYIALPDNTNPAALLQKAYELSSPQGLGFLHAKDGDLTPKEVADILSRTRGSIVLSTDYVNGRAVKFSVRRDEEGLYVPARWFDHDHHSYTELLGTVGVPESTIHAAEAALDAANREYEAEQRSSQTQQET